MRQTYQLVCFLRNSYGYVASAITKKYIIIEKHVQSYVMPMVATDLPIFLRENRRPVTGNRHRAIF